MIRLLVAVVLLACASAGWAADEKKDSIDGTWLPAEAELAGKPFPEEVRKSMKLVIKDGKYTVTVGQAVDKGTVKVMPAEKPKAMDVTGTEGPNTAKTFPAIY